MHEELQCLEVTEKSSMIYANQNAASVVWDQVQQQRLKLPRIRVKENFIFYLFKVLTCVYPILSQQGGQTRHRLSGEVPHSMQHVSGMDPVVIWGQ